MARPRTVLTPQPERAEKPRKGSAGESVWVPPALKFRCRRTGDLNPATASTYHETLAEARSVQEWISEPSILEWLNRAAWSHVGDRTTELGAISWRIMVETLGLEEE